MWIQKQNGIIAQPSVYVVPTTTYAHHVKCTIRYYGDFRTQAKLDEWFRSCDASIHIYPDPDDDELFNFNYRPEVVNGKYGANSYFVHLEFDTNTDQEHIIHNILDSIENNDPHGNYPVNGELVHGDIIHDTLYISK